MAGIIFIAIIFVSLVVTLVAGVIISATGLGAETITMRAVYGIMIYSAFFGIFLLFAKKTKQGNIYESFNLKKPVPKVDVALMLVIALVCITSFVLLQECSVQLFIRMGYYEPDANFRIPNVAVFLMFLITMAVLPAIVEELLFRGLIMQHLMKYGNVVAVIGSAIMFSFFHLNPSQTVYQFILGIVLAIIYIRTKNMWYPIILHFINNALIVTYAYYTYATGGSVSAANFDASAITAMIILAIVGSIVLWGLLGLFRKKDVQWNTERVPMDSKEFWWFAIGMAFALVIWISVFLVQPVVPDTPYNN